jgi:predicted alpha/beta-fold hydrolase
MRRLKALGAYAFHLVYGRLFPPRPEAPCVVCLDPALARGVPALFQPSGRGASFHTVAGALRRKPRSSPFEHTERLMDGEIELHWANRESTLGVVLLFHGLGGSSEGVAMTSLATAFARLGFASVAYNRRGHARGSVLRGAFPEHASVGDAAEVVRHVAARGLPLYAVGVSAGANALVKHPGTCDASGATILAAVSMCCAPDLLGNHSRTSLPALGCG